MKLKKLPSYASKTRYSSFCAVSDMGVKLCS